jgi:hypothetical protein
VIKVFFAGKIGPDDWRTELFPKVHELGGTFTIPNTNFIYNGPFWQDCGHGSRCRCGWRYSDGTFSDAISQIEEADVIFSYINSQDAYGTLVELGYAVAEKKPIFLYSGLNVPLERNDMLWFISQSEYVKEFKCVFNVKQAWQEFCKAGWKYWSFPPDAEPKDE